MIKKFFNRKIKLILTIGLCVLFIAVVFSNTMVKSAPKKENPSIIEFIGFAQQNASLTSSNVWVDIPGVNLNFSLLKSKSVDFRAFGSALISSHSGFRFIIDGVAYGNEQYGDLLISASTGWVPWYIERIVNLSVGNHSVKIQACCYSGTIHIDGEDYDDARLFVQAW